MVQICLSTQVNLSALVHMNRGSIYTPSFKTNHYVPLWGDCTLWSRWLDALVSSPVTEPFKLWPDTNQRPVSTDQTCPVMKTALWNLTGVDRTLAPSVRSLTSQRPVTPDDFTLIKWTDQTLRQHPVTPEPASSQHLTLHSLTTLNYMWMKFVLIDLRAT